MKQLNEWREFSGACFVNTLENWGFELHTKVQ